MPSGGSGTLAASFVRAGDEASDLVGALVGDAGVAPVLFGDDELKELLAPSLVVFCNALMRIECSTIGLESVVSASVGVMRVVGPFPWFVLVLAAVCVPAIAVCVAGWFEFTVVE